MLNIFRVKTFYPGIQNLIHRDANKITRNEIPGVHLSPVFCEKSAVLHSAHYWYEERGMVVKQDNHQSKIYYFI